MESGACFYSPLISAGSVYKMGVSNGVSLSCYLPRYLAIRKVSGACARPVLDPRWTQAIPYMAGGRGEIRRLLVS